MAKPGIATKFKAMGFATTYKERDRLIAELGFDTYAEYISSELWLTIRKRVLDRDGWHCRFCGQRGSGIVHHIQYTKGNLSGSHLKHMVTVCSCCHRKVEFTRGGTKRPLIEAAKFGTKLEKKGRSKHRLAREKHCA